MRQSATRKAATFLGGCLLLFACSLDYLSRDFAQNGGGGDIPDGGGAEGNYCQSLEAEPTFCDDFDKGIHSSWRTAAQGGGLVKVDDGALQISVPANAADAFAYIEKSLSPTSENMLVEFHLTAQSLAGQTKAYQTVRFEIPNGGGTSQVSLTFGDDPNTPDHLEVRVKEHHRFTDGGSKDNGYGVPIPFPIGHAVDVSMQVTPGTPTRVLVSIDQTADERSLSVAIPNAPNAKVALGVVQPESPSTGWNLAIDNVTIVAH
ncbi:hypothetical protein LZC95_38635 [Pendulispora brunnea]|uniref:Uncharacterized protein n=1 Tax=Pendulispora brunnea TaxID=2905690 RepID=A0ABZ2K7M4_9BACT